MPAFSWISVNAPIRSLPVSGRKSLRKAENPGLVSGGDGTGSQTPWEWPGDPGEPTTIFYEKSTWARSASLGTAKMPDPLTGLYILRKHGAEGLNSFVRNVASFAPPSETLRHVGASLQQLRFHLSHAAPFRPDLSGERRSCRGSSSLKQELSPNLCFSTRNPVPLRRKKSAPFLSPPLSGISWQTTRCLFSETTGSGSMESRGKLATEEELTIVFQTFRNHS